MMTSFIRSLRLPQDRTLPLIILVLIASVIGVVVSIPREGKMPAAIKMNAALFDGRKMNVNDARVEDLMQIPRVSRKIAEEIVAYRQSNGAFRSLAELDDIKGIGPKTIAKMEAFLVAD